MVTRPVIRSRLEHTTISKENKEGDDARLAILSINHLPGFDAGGTPVLEPPNKQY
jgi:hypothetical protein